MCEHCQRHKKQLTREIRLLVRREGEEYAKLVEALSEDLPEWKDADGDPMDEDFIFNEMLDVTIAQMIAVRAAFIAYYCDPHTDEGKMPPSIVLGTWAATCLGHEIDQFHAEEFQNMRNALGLNEN